MVVFSRSTIVALTGWLALCGNAPETNTKPIASMTARAVDKGGQPLDLSSSEAKPSEFERPCQQGRDNRNSDLCAQWKAADASREAADWARWQFFLSIAGTAGLLLSIWYTRKAVLAAIQSNESAQESLAHAKEMAAVELRPYLHVEQITYKEPDLLELHGSVIVRIKNFGSTPATRFRVEAGTEFRNIANVSGHSSLGIRMRSWPTVDELPPGHVATVVLPIKLIGKSPDDSLCQFCSVQFWYADKFGSQYMRWETYKGDQIGFQTFDFHFYAHNQGPPN